MIISSHSRDGITVLTLLGKLDFQARHIYQSAVKEAESLKPRHIVLSLEGVTFMNSAGVALVKGLIEKATITRIKVSLAKPQGQVSGFLRSERVNLFRTVISKIMYFSCSQPPSVSGS